MKLYNTMTNKIEDFKTIEKNKVKMYVCGPTVYNYIHLGNARPIVVFDTLARYFKYKGMKVDYVQNFTDIDDKIIKKSIEEKISTNELSEKYIKYFFEDINNLNILKNVKRPKVTENITEIINIIQKLIDNGFAYEKNGNVYFEIKKYKNYGKLSNREIKNLNFETKIETSEEKKNSSDFALWKKKKEGEPFWLSPWGEGRPGWHIECSAISQKFLGNTFDIHGGGQDLIFPHHENEIAQSKCACQGNFANYWLHNGLIQMNDEKMSKSTGNFFLLREVLKKFPGNIIRFFILSTPYRKPIEFSEENLKKIENTFYKILNEMEIFKHFSEIETKNYEINEIKKYDKIFEEALNNDFNTPKALFVIFNQLKYTKKLLKELNELEYESNNLVEDLKKAKLLGEKIKFFYFSLKNKIENILGIELKDKKSKEKNINKEKILLNKVIEIILQIRKEAKEEKKYDLSDKIRKQLNEIGIQITDSKEGTTNFKY